MLNFIHNHPHSTAPDMTTIKTDSDRKDKKGVLLFMGSSQHIMSRSLRC